MHGLLLLSLLVVAGLAGCVGDDGGSPLPPGHQVYAPSAEPSFENVQPATATALAAVSRLADGAGTPVPSAGGIWPYGDFVFGSGLGAGMWIADISEPEHPVVVFNTTDDEITSFARDADVVAHPDGRLILVLATQSDGMHIWDVTEPADPEFLARTAYEDASGNPIPNHNVAAVPGTVWVLNSRSSGEGGTNDVVDLTDPAQPVVIGTVGEVGCHDVTFWGTYGDEKFRAYCPGIQRTEIWDLAGFDVAAGTATISVIAIIDEILESPIVGNDIINTVGYPLRTLHHLAMVNEDASVLIIGDEHNGGGAPGMCLFYDPATGVSTPLGALWFYDLADETAPQLLSWISPPTVLRVPPTVDPENTNPLNPAGILNNLPSCTAHFGTLVPGEDKIVMAWYNAGVLLIDFSTPSSPRILSQFQPDDVFTWDARVHHGYVFTGDISRGMDVLKLV
jgi:hypothetical protein